MISAVGVLGTRGGSLSIATAGSSFKCFELENSCFDWRIYLKENFGPALDLIICEDL